MRALLLALRARHRDNARYHRYLRSLLYHLLLSEGYTRAFSFCKEETREEKTRQRKGITKSKRMPKIRHPFSMVFIEQIVWGTFQNVAKIF